MEKLLWSAVAVLWMSLLAGAAYGGDVVQDAVDRPQRTVEEVVVHNASLTSPVRSAAIAGERMVRPVVQFGQQGSGELAGAALIGAGFVFRALRRRGLV